jgi:hypothetical protein
MVAETTSESPEAICEMQLKSTGSGDLATAVSDYSTESLSSNKSDLLDQRNDCSSSQEGDNGVQNILTDLFVSNLGDLSETRKLTFVEAGTKYHESCSDYHQVQNPFPVTALTAILRRAKSLVCLELCRIHLSGSFQEFTQLAGAIEDQSSLLAFSMEQCRLGGFGSSFCNHYGIY